MVKAGTRVIVNMDNSQESALIGLLNSLGGEVIHNYPDKSDGTQNCLVAYDLEHLDAIQEANNKHFKVKNTQLTVVGLARHLNRPTDKRFYLMAHCDEVRPA